VKPYVRLLALTAPVHDAMDLFVGKEEAGLEDLVEFIETLARNVNGWEYITVMFLIDTPPADTYNVRSWMSGEVIVKLSDSPATEPDRSLFSMTFADLADALVAARYSSEPELSPTTKEILATMWEMLAPDFPEVFEGLDPRQLDD
jgi:hypothetical protein